MTVKQISRKAIKSISKGVRSVRKAISSAFGAKPKRKRKATRRHKRRASSK